VNPVPRGLPTRRERQRPGQGVPLVPSPRTLPQVLEPGEVDALSAALRTHRDRAMVAAMVLGGLRRCEVLGLRLGDLRFGERRVFIAEGKGGHQRLVPVSARFLAEVSAYLDAERPAGAATDAVFTVLKGRRRGLPLTAAGLDEILDGARRRAGLARATCHQLRHTCLTQLRKAGMSLEAVQAQAGHASIESTRIYLHLGDDWLASQYRKAAEAIDAPRPGPPAAQGPRRGPDRRRPVAARPGRQARRGPLPAPASPAGHPRASRCPRRGQAGSSGRRRGPRPSPTPRSIPRPRCGWRCGHTPWSSASIDGREGRLSPQGSCPG
jgi:hypothetical protein